MARPRKRIVSRAMVDLKRDLPALLDWLEQRRIDDMLAGRPHRTWFSTGHVNARIYPMYRKALTHRKEASPGLILLMEAERCGWVRRTEWHGQWEDIRHKVTIGGLVRGKEVAR